MLNIYQDSIVWQILTVLGRYGFVEQIIAALYNVSKTMISNERLVCDR